MRTRIGSRATLAALLGVAVFFPARRASADEQIPGYYFYLGWSLGGVKPFGHSLVDSQPMSTGLGRGFSVHFEARHFLVAAELGSGQFGNDDTYSNPVMLAVRAGPIFGSGRFAPYIAAGPAVFAFGALFDDATGGTGLSAEAGLLMFRQMRAFRATPFFQYNLPLNGSLGGKGAENVKQLSWAAFGLRVEL